VLDILVQSRRDKAVAKKFFRKLLKGLTYVPRVIITDKLKSYGAAKRDILPGVEHRQHRYLNNRAENSHQPTRQRERRMQGVTSPGHAQRFLSAYGLIAHHFRPRRHRLPAPEYRQEMAQRFQRLCCKNRLEDEERLASSRYAANPNMWLMTRFCARTSRLAIPSIWPLRSMCMAS
jgi:hypothetical protein